MQTFYRFNFNSSLEIAVYFLYKFCKATILLLESQSFYQVIVLLKDKFSRTLWAKNESLDENIYKVLLGCKHKLFHFFMNHYQKTMENAFRVHVELQSFLDAGLSNLSRNLSILPIHTVIMKPIHPVICLEIWITG